MSENLKSFDNSMFDESCQGGSSAAGSSGMPRLEIDWPKFLSDSDLLWNRLPGQWHEGAFMGNGLLGAMLYSTESNVLGWRLGRTDIVHESNRVPIGWFRLRFGLPTEAFKMRLCLHDAEISGSVASHKGCLRWHTFTHAHKPLIITQIECDPGVEYSWGWESERPDDPRKSYFNQAQNSPNVTPCEGADRGVDFCRQPLAGGGEHTTAWKRVPRQNGETVFLTISRSGTSQESQHEAISLLAPLGNYDVQPLLDSHRQWWHRYYRKSFISLPDKRLQGFWWVQMYKLASATREDRPMLDLMGPWFRETPWPKIWWNLNAQLAYSPVYAANHLEIGESLCRTLDINYDNLVLNVPPHWREDAAGIGRASSYDCRSDLGHEKGNLVWACHNYWLQMRYSGDQARCREKLLPLLKRAVGLYIRMLDEDDEGRLHLPETHSPEYASAPDCNYDLSLLRWGCITLLEICREGGVDDPAMEKWRHVLDNLVDFPSEDNVWLIGRGVRLEHAHRHYSHLMMFYPLHLVSWDMDDKRSLIRPSVENWLNSPPDKHGQKGYTLTAAAAMHLLMGDNDAALSFLNDAMDRFIQPNTMYFECGPCIETPLSAASVINDMLLQSVNGVVRVFPGVPNSWAEASFFSLRAEGAFLVSSTMQEGQIIFIHILPERGGDCRFVCPFGDAVVEYTTSGVEEKLPAGNPGRLLTLHLRAGEPVIIRRPDAESNPSVSPVRKYTAKPSFHFGCPS